MGGDRAPSNLVFVTLRGRKIEGAERVRIMGIVAWLIYVSRNLTKFCGRNLTLQA